MNEEVLCSRLKVPVHFRYKDLFSHELDQEEILAEGLDLIIGETQYYPYG